MINQEQQQNDNVSIKSQTSNAQININIYKYKENDPSYQGDIQSIDKGLIKGPKENRSSTNCFCAILYICFLVGILIASIFAFQQGSPYNYSYPTDSDGNICGITKGYIDYKYILLLESQGKNSVCVEECPKNLQVTDNKINLKCKSNSKVLSYSQGQCQVDQNEIFESYQSIHSCIPTKDNKLQEKLQPQESFSRNLSDFQRSWPIMLVSMFISLILGYIYIIFMKKCGTCLTWSCILIILLSFLTFGGLVVSGEYQKLVGKQNQNQQQMQWIGGISLFIGIVCLIYIIIRFNRIRIGVALLSCSSEFISDICSIVFLPLILWIFYVLFLVFLAFATVWSYGIGDRILDQGPFESYEYGINRNIYVIFIFGFVWFSQFISNYSYFIISSCASQWYFKKNTPDQLNGVIKKSLKFGFYHFGSIVYGALIFPLFSIINSIYFLFYKCGKRMQKNEIEKSKKQSQSDKEFEEKNKGCSDNCKGCCISCSSYYEAKIRYVQKSGIIQMAFTGKDLFDSCYDSFYLQKRNSRYFHALQNISQLMLLVGKLFIACSSGFICYLILEDSSEFKDQLYSPFLPTITVLYASYTIGNIFVNVFSSSSDTILQVYCIDEELHNESNEKSTNAPAQLVQLLKKVASKQKNSV